MTAADVKQLGPRVTGSKYGRIRKCVGSAVLDRFGHVGGRSAEGNAIHEHLAARVVYGIDAAVELLPQTCARWELDEQQTGIVSARCRSFEWTPPRGSITEVALALGPSSNVNGEGPGAMGRAREVKGGRGVYAAGPEDFAMTLDFIWSEPSPLIFGSDGEPPTVPAGSVLYVVDLKTGEEHNVEPVESNAQIRAGALLASLWVNWEGAEGEARSSPRVVPAIVYVRPGPGIWDTGDVLGLRALRGIGLELARVMARVAGQVAAHKRGERLELVEGTHCTHCDAHRVCPAKLAMIRGVLEDPKPLAAYPLEPEQARRAATMLPQIEAFARDLKQLLRRHVDATGEPIDMGDGNVWGPHPKDRTEILPGLAVQAMVDVGVPGELASKALKITITRDGIEDAIRSAKLPGPLAPKTRAVFGKLQEAGGLRKRTETWYSVFRPPPPPDATPAQLGAQPLESDPDDLPGDS